jgi:tetratricopeptide (TPR) repeat protein
VLAINPNNDKALRDKGALLQSLGRRPEAAELFDRTIEDLQDKGALLRSLGQYAEAAVLFDSALALDPENPVALALKGITMCNLERHRTHWKPLTGRWSATPTSPLIGGAGARPF